MIFSEELIQECIRVFKEENELDITRDTAIEYLQQLTGLYLAFSKN